MNRNDYSKSRLLVINLKTAPALGLDVPASVRIMSCVADDGSAYFTLVERTDNRGYRIHQLELLPFHIVGEQAARIGRESKESAVELAGEFSTESIRDLTMSHKCQKAMSRRARTSTDHRLSYSR